MFGEKDATERPSSAAARTPHFRELAALREKEKAGNVRSDTDVVLPGSSTDLLDQERLLLESRRASQAQIQRKRLDSFDRLMTQIESEVGS